MAPGVQTGGAGTAQSDQSSPIPPSPVQLSPAKRPADGELHRWRTGEETGPTSEEDPNKDRKLNLIEELTGEEDPDKELKLNLIEDLVDTLEGGAVKLVIGGGEVQMRVCEEPLDLSFLTNPEAELLDGALEISNVGVVCSDLKDKAAMCMLKSLCEVSPYEAED